MGREVTIKISWVVLVAILIIIVVVVAVLYFSEIPCKPTPPPIPPDESFLRVVPPAPAICAQCPPGVPPGHCCLVITVQWGNIQPNNGRIYLLARVGEEWWIAGTGISPTELTGQEDITDGSYSIPGQHVKLFACQTTETYLPGKNFADRPTCTLSSPDIFVQTQ
jgi:hypothetical protein